MSILKFKYLMKVEAKEDPKTGKMTNNNKWYKMQENADGTFTATYGREGASKPAVEIYPMGRWDSKLNEKLNPKKGYTDVTEHRTEALPPAKTTVKNSHGVNIIAHDKHVVDIITALQNYANQQTATVYKAEAKGVTQKQVDDAQKQIDTLSGLFKNFGNKSWSINEFNAELTKLYIIIPRKMKNVADYLITSTTTQNEIQTLIGQEQSNLDSMASQVIQQTAQDVADDGPATTVQQQTLLDILGLEMTLVTDANILATVKKKAEEHAKRVLRVFAVTNKATQKEYDNQLRNAADKKTDLMWHGSRRANWYFIIQQGLKIRPSGAVYSGSMWGDGCYYANKADKSMGYTDGGRWAGGRADKVYMALYEVHLGKQLIKTKHDSSCYDLHKNCNKDGYDSVWAKAGASIIRDEFIVYKTNQSTIKYLVEFSS